MVDGKCLTHLCKVDSRDDLVALGPDVCTYGSCTNVRECYLQVGDLAADEFLICTWGDECLQSAASFLAATAISDLDGE